MKEISHSSNIQTILLPWVLKALFKNLFIRLICLFLFTFISFISRLKYFLHLKMSNWHDSYTYAFTCRNHRCKTLTSFKKQTTLETNFIHLLSYKLSGFFITYLSLTNLSYFFASKKMMNLTFSFDFFSLNLIHFCKFYIPREITSYF